MSVPAVPPHNFIKEKKKEKNRQHIYPRHFRDCVSSSIIDRSAMNNSKCFAVQAAKHRSVQKFILYLNSRSEPCEGPASWGKNPCGILLPHQQPMHTVDSPHSSPAEIIISLTSVTCKSRARCKTSSQTFCFCFNRLCLVHNF